MRLSLAWPAALVMIAFTPAVCSLYSSASTPNSNVSGTAIAPSL